MNPIHQWLEGKKKEEDWRKIKSDRGDLEEEEKMIIANYNVIYNQALLDLTGDAPSLLSAMEAEIKEILESADNGTSNSQEVIALIDSTISQYFNDIRG